MKPDTRAWVKKAEDDFKVANQLLRRRKDFTPGAACFHCQQRVEKYLKARLVEAGIAFPRTHDLLQLLNLCLLVEPPWSSFTNVVDALSDYVVDFRYPGQTATLAEARQSLKGTKAVRREVRLGLGLPL